MIGWIFTILQESTLFDWCVFQLCSLCDQTKAGSSKAAICIQKKNTGFLPLMANEDALPFFMQFRCGEGKKEKVSGIMKINCFGNRDNYSLLEVMQNRC